MAQSSGFVAQSFVLWHRALFCGTELEFVTQSFGFAAFKKARKFYFLQSSQNIRERRAFASGNSCFISSRVQKLQNSAFAEFWG